VARCGVSRFVPEELKPFLTYSAGLHVAVAIVAFRFLSSASVKPGQIYTIDFVGPSAMVQSGASAQAEKTTAVAAVESKPAPDTQFDEFGRRKKGKQFVLPRPSLLKGFQANAPEKEEPTTTASKASDTAPAAGASAADGGGGGPPGAGIETDMPNFPYPWYISQVRGALWNMWSSRMPKTPGQCVIVFSILPNGTVVDMRAEESSGDSSFDLTAQSAVQDATPFPALPRGFNAPFLKIHVTLKSQ